MRATLSVSVNHAGSGAGESDLEVFRRQLQANAENAGDYMVLNYSTGYLAGVGEGGGHCSPVAAYDNEEDLVLLLDPLGRSRWRWFAAVDLFGAMNTIDEVSQQHRGWLAVTK